MRRSLLTLFAFLAVFAAACGSNSPVALDAERGIEPAEECGVPDHQPC